MYLAGCDSLVGINGEHFVEEVMGFSELMDVIKGVVCMVDFSV